MKESTDKNQDNAAASEDGTEHSREHKDGGFWSRLLRGGQTASVENLSDELESMEAKLSSLKRDLDDSKSLSQDLKKTLVKRDRENTKLKQELEAERTQCQKIEARAKKESAAAKASAEDRGRLLAEAKAEVKKALSERNKAQMQTKRLANSEQSSKSLESTLAALRKREALLNKAVLSAKSRTEQLERQVAQTKKNSEEAQVQLKSKSEELAQTVASWEKSQSQLRISEAARGEAADLLAEALDQNARSEEQVKEFKKVAQESDRLSEQLRSARSIALESSRLAGQALHRAFGSQIDPVLASAWKHMKGAKAAPQSMSDAGVGLQEVFVGSGICQSCEVSEEAEGLRVSLALNDAIASEPGCKAWVSALATDYLRRLLGRQLSRRVEPSDGSSLTFHVHDAPAQRASKSSKTSAPS